MGEAIAQTIGVAVGIAVSPIPIAAVILMLFSGRARSNSVAFLFAWVVGVALVTTVVALIPGLASEGGQPSDAAGWIKVGLAVLLALVGVRQWRSRPGPDDEPTTPGWMARIDDLTPVAAFGLGFLLSAINPKNLLLSAAAGATIGGLDLEPGALAGSIAVFTVLASLTVGVPVVAYLIAGARLRGTLDSIKTWLIANNSTVMSVLFLVFSVVLLGDGLEILLR